MSQGSKKSSKLTKISTWWTSSANLISAPSIINHSRKIKSLISKISTQRHRHTRNKKQLTSSLDNRLVYRFLSLQTWPYPGALWIWWTCFPRLKPCSNQPTQWTSSLIAIFHLHPLESHPLETPTQSLVVSTRNNSSISSSYQSNSNRPSNLGSNQCLSHSSSHRCILTSSLLNSSSKSSTSTLIESCSVYLYS